MKTALFLLLTVALALGQTITGSSGNFKAVFEKTYDVAKGGSLALVHVEGDVDIHSATANEVKILLTIESDVDTRVEMQEIVEHEITGISRKNDVITVSGVDHDGKVERDYHIVVPTQFDLKVQTENGDVQITGTDGRIDLESANGDIALKEVKGAINVNTAGGDLDFTNVSGALQAHSSGGDVTIKNISGESTIHTDGGDLDLSNSKSKMKMTTFGGDITLTRIAGSLDVETMGGDITLDNAEGEKIALHSMGGDISIINSRVPLIVATEGGDIDVNNATAETKVRTSGGSIVLADLQAGASAVTMGGDIDITMTLRDMKKPHAVQAETTGGDVTIELPSRLPATITAEVMIARRSGNRNDIYSDFPLTKEPSDETGDRILRSKGEINGGGDAIVLTSHGGSVYIKKGL
jgi:hypothetical protein